jgi:hypothetical protein
MSVFKNSRSIINILLILLILTPLTVYTYYIFHFSINVPRQDDYDAVLGFLIGYNTASFPEKIALLFSQQNEHRILFSRIVYVLYYTITGTINFRHIILLNLLVLMTLFSVVAYFIRKAIPGQWLVAVTLLSFGLFDLNNFENADFAMAGLQNYGIILLFVGSMFFYSRQSNKYLVPAVLLQVLCVFSSGNGSVAAFFIVLFVALNKVRLRTITSLVTFLVTAPLYYIGYQQPTNDFVTTDPSKFVPFFLHALAAHFSNDYGIIIGVLLLVLLLITLPIGKKFTIKNNTLPLLCMAGFILTSLGVMSIFRGGLPINVSYSSRYFVYSHLFVAILFVFIIIRLQNRATILAGVETLTLLLALFIYKQNAEYGDGGFNWQYNCLKTRQFDYPFPDKAKKIADESCQLNIYCIDEHRQD